MYSHHNDITSIQSKLRDALKVIKIYEWLLDSYVLDFYVDNHWDKMPKSWIQTLGHISPEHLTDLLIPPVQNTECTVWPLSLLALRTLMQRLCIPREPISFSQRIDAEENQSDSNNNPKKKFNCLTHPKIGTVLTKKNIKAKKRHEIERMSQLTVNIARELNVNYVVDFGSGLGHLARVLAYGHGLRVCCLEKEITLTDQANELDNQLTDLATRFCTDEITFRRPVHLNICLNRDTSFKDLVAAIKKSFGIAVNETFKFGIIGLHPCGDLASILTNFYLQSSEAKFLNLVGCCYFKIQNLSNSTNIRNKGYPLSEYLNRHFDPNDYHLSFVAREISCHAIEVYANRLSDKNYDNLRVHSFRAAIEKIICKYWPEKKRSGLRSIKRLTTFRDYCHQAVSHLDGIHIPDHDIDSTDTLANLERWKSVVIFYTLRLVLAPLVESVILYDRLLCLLEHGCHTKIDAIFDPVISARNHIITAVKS
ncbi:protein RRNAD1 [Contarinia nasturtii]|uniref:protein RRNAD1 n=1 Tax=Contarinia nasturtii TaxID=265458 RepID=UPI0012D3BBA3|nr:protein RRNAD1 [Contarinia nasturtii]